MTSPAVASALAAVTSAALLATVIPDQPSAADVDGWRRGYPEGWRQQ